MTEVTYRRAAVEDAPGIHTLLCENAANDGGEIKGSAATLVQHGFGPAEKFRVVLAEQGGEALGLCLFFPEYSSWRGKMGVFVQDLYVRPVARGLGLGRGLLVAAMTQAKDWDPAFLTLMVQDKNTQARAFYANLGFTLREQADLLMLEGAALSQLTR